MKAAGALLGVLIALGVAYMILQSQWSSKEGQTVSPRQRIDVTGVKSDLLSIAQAERLYLASHNSYATLEQLQEDGSLTFSGARRRGYNYTVEVDGAAHFKITATPSEPERADWPTLMIDDTLEISTQ